METTLKKVFEYQDRTRKSRNCMLAMAGVFMCMLAALWAVA